MAKKINFFLAALKQPGNLVYLAFAGGLALLLGFKYGLILALGFGAIEAIYLLNRGRSKKFRRKILRKLGWGGEVTTKQLDQAADVISDTSVERYRLFRKHVNTVVDLADSRDMDDDPLIAGVLANLQTMSLSYLKLLLAEAELKRIITTTDPEKIKRQLADLEEKIQQAKDVTLVRTLEQNQELLTRRLKRYKTAADKKRNVSAQLDLMDSTVKLLREQAADFSSPADITAQVDVVLTNMHDARVLQGEVDHILIDETELASRVQKIPAGGNE
ncbi:MAG: hypothetical protein ACTSXZ_04240 [Alphaproteobacteria bacterium]